MTDLTKFGVSLASLHEAAKGIEDAISALADIGFKQTADVGRGVTFLEIGEQEMGHAKLHGALDGFCGRWEYGVRTLIREGHHIHDNLLDTRSGYQKAEDSISGVFKRMSVDFSGNPLEDSSKAADKSWSQLAQENTPDYSAKSFVDASHTIEQNAKQAGHDYIAAETLPFTAPSKIIDTLGGKG